MKTSLKILFLSVAGVSIYVSTSRKAQRAIKLLNSLFLPLIRYQFKRNLVDLLTEIPSNGFSQILDLYHQSGRVNEEKILAVDPARFIEDPMDEIKVISIDPYWINVRTNINASPRNSVSVEYCYSPSKLTRTIPCLIKYLRIDGINELLIDIWAASAVAWLIFDDEIIPAVEDVIKKLSNINDCLAEARMQKLIKENISTEFYDIVVPKVVDYLVVNDRTMACEDIDGSEDFLAAVTKVTVDEKILLVTRMIQAIGRMILVDGIFHALPIPSNWKVVLRNDWENDSHHKLVLLNFNFCKEIFPYFKRDLRKLVSMINKQSSQRIIAAQMRILGFKTRNDLDYDYKAWADFFFVNSKTGMSDAHLDTFVRVPEEFGMLSVCILSLQKVIKLTDTDRWLNIGKLWQQYANKE